MVQLLVTEWCNRIREADRPDEDEDADDEVPETPPTEPEPVPIEEPPDAPGHQGPYIVSCRPN